MSFLRLLSTISATCAAAAHTLLHRLSAAMRREEAIGSLDRLERQLAHGGDVIVAPAYGAADVVWTVFLARMEFVDMEKEIDSRPALVRYWRTMKARPGFAAADIWTRMQVGRLIRGIIYG